MDVIAMARELGAALQQSDEYTAYNVAKNAADGDEVLQEMIGEFNLKKLSLSTEVQKEEKDQERLDEYKSYGVTKEGKSYYYQGQLVRVFLDMEGNRAFYTLENNPLGVVDVKITRGTEGKIQTIGYMEKEEAGGFLPTRRAGRESRAELGDHHPAGGGPAGRRRDLALAGDLCSPAGGPGLLQPPGKKGGTDGCRFCPARNGGPQYHLPYSG